MALTNCPLNGCPSSLCRSKLRSSPTFEVRDTSMFCGYQFLQRHASCNSPSLTSYCANKLFIQDNSEGNELDSDLCRKLVFADEEAPRCTSLSTPALLMTPKTAIRNTISQTVMSVFFAPATFSPRLPASPCHLMNLDFISASPAATPFCKQRLPCDGKEASPYCESPKYESTENDAFLDDRIETNVGHDKTVSPVVDSASISALSDTSTFLQQKISRCGVVLDKAAHGSHHSLFGKHLKKF